jgi:uncharacterized protein (TIGR02594 family)
MGTKPDETYEKTGDLIVVFAGGGGARQFRYRKTRPSPSRCGRGGAGHGERRGRRAQHSPASGTRNLAQARAAAQSHANSAYGGFTNNSLVAEARKYIGTNPTGRRSLWCGAFMDMVLKRTGHKGGGNLAFGYSHYGRRISGPQVGAIAVMGRHGGGHVGVVSGVDANGNPIIVSGNHNHTVAESVYPRSRISAYVLPGS